MDEQFDRRSFLRATSAAAATGTVALAGCTGGGQDPTPKDRFGGWMDGVSNYDGTVVDATGTDEVTVKVGTEGNGGYYAFSPPAVKISTGTTVVWEWTGRGGGHNVVEEGGGYESQLTAAASYTFSHAFDGAGVSKYYCDPHRQFGMKGVVEVV